MPKVVNICQFIDAFAPFKIQEDFDNAGFLVGRRDQEVTKILVSLDITHAVVEEAAQWGAQLIVAHHPVIFHPVKWITDETPTGQILLELIENKIAAICAHTNLDAAQGGVNDCLAEALELTGIGQLHQAGVDGQGRPYRNGPPAGAVRQGVRRLCEGEAGIRQCPLCKRRKTGAEGGGRGRGLRLHDKGRDRPGLRHLRHRRREIRPVPGGQGPGAEPAGCRPLSHGECGMRALGPVAV